MESSTKLGLGLGMIVAVGSLIHTTFETVKDKPLETLVAGGIIVAGTTGATKLAYYVANKTSNIVFKPLRYSNKNKGYNSDEIKKSE